MANNTTPIDLLNYHTYRLFRRVQAVEERTIELAIFLLKGNVNRKCLTDLDVSVARLLVDKFGVIIPWVVAVAQAGEFANLVSVAEVAQFAMDTEGEI